MCVCVCVCVCVYDQYVCVFMIMAMQPQCLTAFNETDPLRFTGSSEQQPSYLKRHTPRVPTFPPFPSPSYPPFIFLMLPSFHYQLHGVFNTPLTNKAKCIPPHETFIYRVHSTAIEKKIHPRSHFHTQLYNRVFLHVW